MPTLNEVTGYCWFLVKAFSVARKATDIVRFCVVLLTLFLFSCVAQAALVAALPIFPGAVGFGTRTPAGSGRFPGPEKTRVFKVTHLRANGVGSLQDCIYAKGPRTCVFEVSGTIDLTGDKSYGGSEFINLTHPFITIAGQTAPSPGITVRGKTLRIEAHDVFIQHLRFRLGDSKEVSNPPDVRDTILIAGNNDRAHRTPHNIVIDHCSVSWGIDEVVSIKDSSHNITLTNNIISEGLDRSLHPKGRHSKGLMAVGNKLSIYRNLIANVQDRAPLDISPTVEYINNLSHNAKYTTLWPLSRSSFYSKQSLVRQATFVSNVRSKGANTADRGNSVFGKVNSAVSTDAQIFVRDNYCEIGDRSLSTCGLLKQGRAINTASLKLPSSLDVWPAHKVMQNIILNVGARPLDRDSVDMRILQEVATNTGDVPDCVSGNPIYYPEGPILESSPNQITIELGYCYAGRFDGYDIDISAGAGKAQSTTVLKHSCDKSGANLLTVSDAWSSKLDESSVYRIKNACNKHAGGWPMLEENRRSLSLPDNYNELQPSGYTRLEEYLHKFNFDVEASIE